MPLFRKRPPTREFYSSHPAGFPPINADQHKSQAMYQLWIAELHPEVAAEYLAAAHVHMLAALLYQNEEIAARATMERQLLADSARTLLTGMHDLLTAPRSVDVRIFHNLDESDPLTVYTAADPLVEVYAYLERDVFPGTHDHVIADNAMQLFCNTASLAMDEQHGEQYRRRGNRPLREGDAVAVEGRFYVSTALGWHPVLSPKLVDTGSARSVSLLSVPEPS